MKTQKPEWLKAKAATKDEYHKIQDLMEKLNLHTVCQEANCPNLGECFSKGTATFMILGDLCTRNCRFCAVQKGLPTYLDEQEPQMVAEAAQKMELKHVVVTSVTRDDLADNGAKHYARTIEALHHINEGITVEVLIPDLQGSEQDLITILETSPEILNHNLETVPRLYETVRPMANYSRSLELLKRVKQLRPDILTKTGIMVGLGETEDEVIQLMKDIVEIDCDILTIGQYLQPSQQQLPVKTFVHPDQFKRYETIGKKMGIPYVASGPFVRSSYNAIEAIKKLRQ
ncbi:lipoyl synthase [Fusibacter ferrireducens]|uniref:Lipoyl synthase n=1 Tax=Fusibacter ferrireducens TaxID=2785058 RepID=A0ABR9ZV34_9FIRM|nr:lipoyl synthase [Fusibacter ferrireducens]